MAPTPEQQKLIDEALKEAQEKMRGNTTTVMHVYGNGVVKSQDSSVKIIKGSQ